MLKYKPNISVNVFRNNSYNIIEISDNAGSIEDDVIEHIFNPYFTTKENGTGLGLYMAKVIVEDKMNGKINVRNENEKVIFKIKMPIEFKNENTIT